KGVGPLAEPLGADARKGRRVQVVRQVGGAIARVNGRDVAMEGVERRALSRERCGVGEQAERGRDDRSQSFAARRHRSAMAACPAGVGWTPSAAQYAGVLLCAKSSNMGWSGTKLAPAWRATRSAAARRWSNSGNQRLS